ncbi:MAG: GNAT family N-acetyltransferase [Stappia sp.]|uniref:GNAT family N-acetyltransferase n=1 Tax=Stappia sp. TaxID=1870903 RepID=UPI000C49685E|nr:GNAT family N-acetyltransferase [Stappia sp.]MAA99325.1 GNAT family N-acetyltransferase [Stappia sp.]MBM19291.1 GNAT family N-acetyltransferase [Stappia sp.]
MVADLEDSLEEESLEAALLPQDTDRLRLDLPRADDLADLVFLANNRRIATMLAHLPHPFTIADGRAYIANAARHTANRAKFAVRMRSTGRIIGAVGYSVLDEGGPVHLGYWIGEPFWGQGFATEAAQAMVDHVFSTTPMHVLAGAARVTNPASRRVLVKCGFQFSDQGMISSRGAGGPISVDRFMLDRSTWRALKRWGRNSCLESA